MRDVQPLADEGEEVRRDAVPAATFSIGSAQTCSNRASTGNGTRLCEPAAQREKPK
jgi:hypothetical protein